MVKRVRRVAQCTLLRQSCMHYIIMTSSDYTQCYLWLLYAPPYSKAVIGVGVEDEDRMDQWIEDAESVSKLHHARA